MMSGELEDLAAAFIKPDRLFAPSEILSAITDRSAKGVYGWWFKNLPHDVPVDGALVLGGWTLLYCGASERPIRDRIREHLRPDASRSTLRLSLGCLLSQQLNIALRVCRVVKGKTPKYDLGDGESRLSEWMERNARISWVQVQDDPLSLESHLIQSLTLPLNLDANEKHPFCAVLSGLRSKLRGDQSVR